MTTKATDWESRLEIPGRVSFQDGQGGLRTVRIKIPGSEAEVYLQGAQVTHFQKSGELPLLFLSQNSRFQEGTPIRGGVPVIFPWFGPREGYPSHGFARLKAWDLEEVTLQAAGTIRLHFRWPEGPESANYPPFTADYLVTVGPELVLQLVVSNRASAGELRIESCLHTYFAIGDLQTVEIAGLKGASYLDCLDHSAPKVDGDDLIRIASEVDRTYIETTATVEILDRAWQRRIRIMKEGSRSTVVWNPWIAKAQRLPDFGDQEYRRMVCVESGNVGPNTVTLRPGESSVLTVALSQANL